MPGRSSDHQVVVLGCWEEVWESNVPGTAWTALSPVPPSPRRLVGKGGSEGARSHCLGGGEELWRKPGDMDGRGQELKPMWPVHLYTYCR